MLYRIKRMAVLALSLTLLVSLCACGGGEGSVNKDGGEEQQVNYSSVFPNRQTIAAGNSISVAIKKDSNEVRVSGPSLFSSVYEPCDSISGTLKYNRMPLDNVVSVDVYEYFAALKSDGTVCTGVVSKHHGKSAYEAYRLSEADKWTDIKQIAIGLSQVIGLTKDGKVLAVGYSGSQFKGVDQWSDIVDIDAGENITVALQSDGTVLTCDLAPDVSDWKDIKAVSCSSNFIVGLKSDGTVVAASGQKNDPRTKVKDWSDIVAVSAGLNHCVGLRSDGTVVSTKITRSEYDKGQTDVDSWTDIVEISANYTHTLGLKSDGTIVCAGAFEEDNDQYSLFNWNDIVIP